MPALLLEKLQVALFFENLDLGGHARLGNKQFSGGQGKILPLRCLIKHPELVQVDHAPSGASRKLIYPANS
jgi:hypothetical protein